MLKAGRCVEARGAERSCWAEAEERARRARVRRRRVVSKARIQVGRLGRDGRGFSVSGEAREVRVGPGMVGRE